MKTRRPAYRNRSNLTGAPAPRSGAGFTAALLCATLLAGASPNRAESPTPAKDERAAVLAVVTQLFDGMRTKDAQLIQAQFLPDALLGEMSPAAFAQRVGASEAYLDEVTFDETVLIDGDLAMAWTPYNLFVDGAFHHCGVDLFVMKRSDQGWAIKQLEDTRRTEGCEEDRRS